MELTVGSRVILLRDMMNESVGSVGFVVDTYDDFDGLGTGVQIIFQNGSFDGFGVKEQNLYLEDMGVDSRYAMYEFKSVIRTDSDFRNGHWRFNE